MLLVVFVFFTCIYGQRYNGFFDDRDLDYPVARQRVNPNVPWGNIPKFNQGHKTPKLDYEDYGRPIRPPPNMEYRDYGRPHLPKSAVLNRFTEMERIKEMQDDARGFGPYGKQLLQEANEKITGKHSVRNDEGPSPGMGMYWEEEISTPKSSMRTGPFMSRQQMMELAIQKLQSINKLNENPSIDQMSSALNQIPQELPPPQQLKVPSKKDKKPSGYPTVDDFGSPIRWVPINSKDTNDGLAKVTNFNTGKNRQYIVNGTIFVPVIDYSLERLGITTTTLRPKVIRNTTQAQESTLKIVAKYIDLDNIDQGDWLAFESALGGKKFDKNCDDEGCQARCTRLGCESKCRGDTCSSGCVGGSCSTFCKGPGCFAMCIGESCSARCEGISCEARCRGDDCEAGCRSFSCKYLKNGDFQEGGGIFSEHYPQYDTYNIKGNNQLNI